MANGDTKTESYLRAAAEGTRADLPTDTCCNTKTQNLILGVANRIMDVEDEVEELKNNPDVVDIVDTYADLQAYDTSTLTDKDIIRVLEDSTHSNSSTYYRWNATTNQFDYIGEAGGGGPFTVLDDNVSQDWIYHDEDEDTDYIAAWKLPAGKYTLAEDSSIGILIGLIDEGNPTYSISDTFFASQQPVLLTDGPATQEQLSSITVVYVDGYGQYIVDADGLLTYFFYPGNLFEGTDGVSDGQPGLVPAPEATDVDKFLKSDGSWGAAVTLSQLNTRLDNMTLLKITQTAYDQLQTKDPNTLYIIIGA